MTPTQHARYKHCLRVSKGNHEYALRMVQGGYFALTLPPHLASAPTESFSPPEGHSPTSSTAKSLYSHIWLQSPRGRATRLAPTTCTCLRWPRSLATRSHSCRLRGAEAT
jgi:hypothetical protein